MYFCMFSNAIAKVFQCTFTSFPMHFYIFHYATYTGILINICRLNHAPDTVVYHNEYISLTTYLQCTAIEYHILKCKLMRASHVNY